jgi:hypothetical protein
LSSLRSAFQDAVRKRPFSLVGSALLIAAAVANVLDATTTAIGLRAGLAESNPMTIMLLHTYGVAGFAAEKSGFALVFLLIYAYQRPRWERANYVYCFIVFSLAAVALFIFGYPVINNFAVILSHYGF